MGLTALHFEQTIRRTLHWLEPSKACNIQNIEKQEKHYQFYEILLDMFGVPGWPDQKSLQVLYGKVQLTKISEAFDTIEPPNEYDLNKAFVRLRRFDNV